MKKLVVRIGLFLLGGLSVIYGALLIPTALDVALAFLLPGIGILGFTILLPYLPEPLSPEQREELLREMKLRILSAKITTKKLEQEIEQINERAKQDERRLEEVKRLRAIEKKMLDLDILCDEPKHCREHLDCRKLHRLALLLGEAVIGYSVLPELTGEDRSYFSDKAELVAQALLAAKSIQEVEEVWQVYEES